MTRRAIHPGEFLADELAEIEMSGAELARRIKVPSSRITQILAGKRSLSADSALRLGRFFGSGPQIWINLQKAYELDLAQCAIGSELDSISQRPLEPIT